MSISMDPVALREYTRGPNLIERLTVVPRRELLSWAASTLSARLKIW